jgi:hypothetical protein
MEEEPSSHRFMRRSLGSSKRRVPSGRVSTAQAESRLAPLCAGVVAVCVTLFPMARSSIYAANVAPAKESDWGQARQMGTP